MEPERREALYTAQQAAAIKEGKLPTTAQATAAIDRAIRDPEINAATKTMSPTGKTVVKDFQDVLGSAKTVLQEKNQGDEIQKAIYHASAAGNTGRGTLRNMMDLISPTEAAEAKENARKGMYDAATLTRLFISSPHFRQLILQGVDILQDLFRKNAGAMEGEHDWRSAQFASGYDNTSSIPTGYNQQYSYQQQQQGYVDPNMPVGGFSNVPMTPNMPVGGVSNVPMTPNMPVGGVSNVPMTSNIQYDLNGLPITPGATIVNTYVASQGMTMSDWGFTQPAMNTTTTTPTVPTPWDHSEAGRKFYKNYSLSPDQERRLIDQIITWIESVRASPENQRIFSSIFSNFGNISTLASSKYYAMKDRAATSSSASAAQDHSMAAWANTKVVLERFMGGHSLDPLLNTLSDLIDEIRDNQEATAYMNRFQAFFRRAWEDQSFLNDREAIRLELRSLVRDGRRLFVRRFRPYVKRIGSEIRILRPALTEDETTTDLTDNFRKLGRDLFLDSAGKPTIKPELMLDFEKLFPVLLDKIKYIPIPHQFISNADMDLTLDNVVIHLPQMSRNHFRVSTTTEYIDNEARALFHVHISRLQADARGFDFEFVSKRRIKTRDAGKADFYIFGDGLTLNLTIRPVLSSLVAPSAAPGPLFHVIQADCSIHKVKLNLYETKRDWLYKMLMPLARTTLRKRIEVAIERALTESVGNLERTVKGTAPGMTSTLPAGTVHDTKYPRSVI